MLLLFSGASGGGGGAANLCGGGRKSSSKTGDPGESRSSELLIGSAGNGCLGLPPPKASLKVHHVAKTSGGGTLFFLGLGPADAELPVGNNPVVVVLDDEVEI